MKNKQRTYPARLVRHIGREAFYIDDLIKQATNLPAFKDLTEVQQQEQIYTLRPMQLLMYVIVNDSALLNNQTGIVGIEDMSLGELIDFICKHFHLQYPSISIKEIKKMCLTRRAPELLIWASSLAKNLPVKDGQPINNDLYSNEVEYKSSPRQGGIGIPLRPTRRIGGD